MTITAKKNRKKKPIMSSINQSKKVELGNPYHVVMVPKLIRKPLYRQQGDFFGKVLREHADEKGCIITKLELDPDFVYMVIQFPSTPQTKEIIGHIKGSVAIEMLNRFPQQCDTDRIGKSFWVPGFYLRKYYNKRDILKYVCEKQLHDCSNSSPMSPASIVEDENQSFEDNENPSD